MRPPILWATALLLAAAWCPPLQAGRDPDDIRRLRNTGEILSLETIISQHRRSYPSGQLLEAELEQEHGRYIYELKFLDQSGVVQEFEYDARTGQLWHIEPKHPEKD